MPSPIFLTLLLFALATTAQGARYEAEPLPGGTIHAINGLGKLVGAVNGQATLWKKNPAGEYEAIDLHALLPAEIQDSQALDLNTPNGENGLSELIVGHGLTADNHRQALLWQLTDAANNLYQAELLPHYIRKIPLCDPEADLVNNCYNNADELVQDYSGCTALNTEWVFGDPWIVECDTESVAVGVNDNGLIIGSSFREENGQIIERPVFWIKQAADEDQPDQPAQYLAIDLTGKLDDSGTFITRPGRPLAIADRSNTIAGILFNNDDPNDRPYPALWNNVNASGFLGPDKLVKSEDPGDDYPDEAWPTAFNGNVATGWYRHQDGQPRQLAWLYSGRDAENNAIIIPFELPGLAATSLGKLLRTNGSETVASLASRNDPADPGYRAAYFTTRCGQQDLNELLITPFADGTVLTAGYEISNINNSNANWILAQSENGGLPGPGYLLSPARKRLDLALTLSADREQLVTGQDFTFTVAIHNNGDPENPNAGQNDYATCLKLSLVSSIYLEDPERNQRQRPGGFTFLEARAEQADSGVSCRITVIDVNCDIPRLEQGQSITIIIRARPRQLLADRVMQTRATLIATEETLQDITPVFGTPPSAIQANNSQVLLTRINREGCFIATAAYGSYLEPQVQALRDFRDQVLQPHPWGRWLIDQYYRHSPPLAAHIADSPRLRALARGLLTPLVLIIAHPLAAGLALLAVATGMAWLWRRSRQRVAHPL